MSTGGGRTLGTTARAQECHASLNPNLKLTRLLPPARVAYTCRAKRRDAKVAASLLHSNQILPLLLKGHILCKREEGARSC